MAILSKAIQAVDVALNVTIKSIESVGHISTSIHAITQGVETVTTNVVPMLVNNIISSYTDEQARLIDEA